MPLVYGRGMVKTLLYMAVCVPALAFGQVDSVQSGQEVSTGIDSTVLVVPVDSAQVPKPREAVLEGREVIGRRRGATATEPLTLSREELARSATLADALARLPGVEVRRMGGIGGYAEVALRHSPSQQVRVVVDGVAWKDQGSSSVDLGQFPTDGLEKVQVLQGAAAGSSGVPELRIQTRSAWLKRGASVGVGSFGERSLSGWWGDRDGIWSGSAWVQTSRNDWPVKWDRGTIYNTKDDTIVSLANNDFTGYGVGGAWRGLPDWKSTLRIERTEKGGAGLYVARPTARWNENRIQWRLESESEEVWSFPVSMGGRWTNSDWRDSGSGLDYRSNRQADETGLSGDVRWGAKRQAGDWADGWLAVLGRGELDSWTTTTPQEIRLTPDASRLGGGVSTGWTGKSDSGSWGSEAVVRMEWLFDRANFTENGMAAKGAIPDSSAQHAEFDAKVRIWLHPNGAAWKVWMGAASSRRVPDFYELYGDNGLTFASPKLRPEQNLSAEWGAGWDSRSASVKTSIWIARYEDPIRRKMIGASMASRFENDSGYLAAGWEFDAKICSDWGSVGGRIDLSRTWLESEYAAVAGNEMDRSPKWKWNISADTPRWRGLVLQAGLDAIGPSWASPLNRPDDRISGRMLWNAGLVWNKGPVRASLQSSNLTDRRFEEFENAPLSGRSWRAQLQCDFATHTKEQI
jgi:hypothetical protein